jgi:hypothetical protein
MKGYNLPDNVSASDPDAPWNKEEQKECTCPKKQPENKRLRLADVDCPIHGLTEKELQTI